MLMVLEEMAADGEQLFPFRHVGAGGDVHLGWADVEVKAAAGGLLQAVARPPGGDIALIGTLVLAEADVAVDAHDGPGGRPDVVGGEVLKCVVDLFYECEHGAFNSCS